jgi:hypothetical protein
MRRTRSFVTPTYKVPRGLFGKRCGVEPQAYLTDVITKIVNGHPNSKLDDLLPWTYPANPALRDVA